MNKIQHPVLYSLPVMVLALLLANLNRNPVAGLLPWLFGMGVTASPALVHRPGLQLKQCVSNAARSSLLSHSLCADPWGDEEEPKTHQQSPSSEDVHLIVLIHGWLGNPKEMDGLKESLMEQSQIQMDTNKENQLHRVVVHSVRCNDGRTSDGIAAGGQRVAVEINQVIQEIWNQDQQDNDDGENKKHHRRPNIKLSIVGNSLGGLYGRYAVSEIQWTEHDEEQQAQLIPHYFVTTATPHLGCGFQQTYLPLPRFIEHPIGNIMLRTGKDLFRLDSDGKRKNDEDKKPDIIQEMTFSPTFITPLAKFRKRMAYANAHGTDFQVPLPTAAFLAPTDSIHHTLELEANTSEQDDEENRIIIPKGVALTLTTPKKEANIPTIMEPKEEIATAEEISQQLDQLGWTKVLIDVRHEMPINLNEPTTTSDGDSQESSIPPPKQEWTAKELLEEFDNGRLKSLPIGHMVMVANSKNEFYRNMCKSGIPIMDYLAKEIINSI